MSSSAPLSDRLKERIVGQDEAVEAVSRAIRRSRVGISPRRGRFPSFSWAPLAWARRSW